jgi:hypothetical protein
MNTRSDDTMRDKEISFSQKYPIDSPDSYRRSTPLSMALARMYDNELSPSPKINRISLNNNSSQTSSYPPTASVLHADTNEDETSTLVEPARAFLKERRY